MTAWHRVGSSLWNASKRRRERVGVSRSLVEPGSVKIKKVRMI